jgi:hypothetical protein
VHSDRAHATVVGPHRLDVHCPDRHLSILHDYTVDPTEGIVNNYF